jgi:hypothetical protein
LLGASLYIVVCSARNRLLVRLRRLREPRYLLGALFAIVYFYFMLVVPRRAAGRRGGGDRGIPSSPALDEYGWPLGGAAMFTLASLAWILPSKSTLFHFTEAETAFLFPAPVSRRQLLIYRLMRSQPGLLFAAMVPAFLMSAPGTISISGRVLRGLALWVTFATIRVYFAGVTMARQRLRSADPRARRLAWAPLLATVAAVAGVAVPLVRTARAAAGLPFPEMIAELGAAVTTGLPGAVLWPFRTLLAPLFAEGAVEYLAALAGSLVVLLASIAWVLKSDEVFVAAVEDSVAQEPAAARRRRPAPRVRSAGWPLAISGRIETAIMWKNAMQTLRGTSLKSLLPPLAGLTFGVVFMTIGVSQARGLAPALFLVALVFGFAMPLLGPLSLMNDLRGDLRHLEVLKTWPVRGGAFIRGEILWPGVLLTAGSWLAFVAATILSSAAAPQIDWSWRLSACLAAILVAPALVFAHYTIHQAVAVLFPAWVPLDNEMRGFDSMAQRLILFAVVLLALLAMMGPGAIAGGITGFVLFRLTGSPLALVPAAATCLVIVGMEVLLATEALGPAFERIDLMSVERAE